MDNNILNLPSPLMSDKFELLRKGVYCNPETNVWINQNKSFAYLDPLPIVNYENYIPRVEQLGLSKYKQNSSVLESRFEKINHIIKKKKSILEIGSADGSFLKLVHQHFPDLLYYSVEPDISTSPYRDKLSWLVQYGHLSEAVQNNVKVDVVALFHVFEHIEKPNEFLKLVSKILTEDGVILIEVPCLMDPLLSVFHLSSYQEFYFQCQHPFVYSEESLCRVLKCEGFDVQQVIYHQRYGMENHLQWLSKGLPGGNQTYKEMFKNIDKDYRSALESKGKTDSIMIIAKTKR